MLPKPPACEPCPFYTTGIGFVPPEGSPDASLRACAEAPGEDEVAVGRPLVGKTGSEFRRTLKFMGLGEQCGGCGDVVEKRRECAVCVGVGAVFPQVYLHNTIQCRPSLTNDYSLVPPGAVEFCQRAHVVPPPDGAVVLLVGGRALEAHFPGLGVAKWRGSILLKEE